MDIEFNDWDVWVDGYLKVKLTPKYLKMIMDDLNSEILTQVEFGNFKAADQKIKTYLALEEKLEEYKKNEDENSNE